MHTNVNVYICCEKSSVFVDNYMVTLTAYKLWMTEWNHCHNKFLQGIFWMTMFWFQGANDNWFTLSDRLTEEVLEPLSSYQKPFVDVKVNLKFQSCCSWTGTCTILFVICMFDCLTMLIFLWNSSFEITLILESSLWRKMTMVSFSSTVFKVLLNSTYLQNFQIVLYLRKLF